MPIQHAIWKVGDDPQPLSASHLASERQLEEMIVREPRILTNEWLSISRKEVTGHGGRIGQLTIAPDVTLVLSELKKSQRE